MSKAMRPLGLEPRTYSLASAVSSRVSGAARSEKNGTPCDSAPQVPRTVLKRGDKGATEAAAVLIVREVVRRRLVRGCDAVVQMATSGGEAA